MDISLSSDYSDLSFGDSEITLENRGPTEEELIHMKNLMALWLTAPFLFGNKIENSLESQVDNVLKNITEFEADQSEMTEENSGSGGNLSKRALKPPPIKRMKYDDLSFDDCIIFIKAAKANCLRSPGRYPKESIVQIAKGRWREIYSLFNASASIQLSETQLRNIWKKMKTEFLENCDDYCNWKKYRFDNGEVPEHLLVFQKAFYDKKFLSDCTFTSPKDQPDNDERIRKLRDDLKKVNSRIDSVNTSVGLRLSEIEEGIALLDSLKKKLYEL